MYAVWIQRHPGAESDCGQATDFSTSITQSWKQRVTLGVEAAREVATD
jgi:hypothetical protein